MVHVFYVVLHCRIGLQAHTANDYAMYVVSGIITMVYQYLHSVFENGIIIGISPGTSDRSELCVLRQCHSVLELHVPPVHVTLHVSISLSHSWSHITCHRLPQTP